MGYGNFIGHEAVNAKYTNDNGGVWNLKDVYKESLVDGWDFSSPQYIAHNTTTTNTFTYPSGIRSGDFILLVSCANGTNARSGFTGFFEIASQTSNPRYTINYRIADGTETGNITSSTGTNEAGMICVFGSNSRSIYDTISPTEAPNDPNGDVTAEVTTGNYSSNITLIAAAITNDANSSLDGTPSGYTLIAGVAGGGVGLAILYKTNNLKNTTYNTAGLSFVSTSTHRGRLISIV